jgi:hypothetical protein
MRTALIACILFCPALTILATTSMPADTFKACAKQPERIGYTTVEHIGR